MGNNRITKLSPAEATTEAAGALAAAGLAGFSITSKTVHMPKTFGDAILTTASATAPLTDVRDAMAVLRTLPGFIQAGTTARAAFAYRSQS